MSTWICPACATELDEGVTTCPTCHSPAATDADLERRWRQWSGGSPGESPGDPGRSPGGGPGARGPAEAAAVPTSEVLPVGEGTQEATASAQRFRWLVVAVVGVLVTTAAGIILASRHVTVPPGQQFPPGILARSSDPGAPARLRSLTELATASSSDVAITTVGPDGSPISSFAGNVLDGNPMTAWRVDAPGTGALLQLDFSRPVVLTEVALAAGEHTSAVTSPVGRHGSSLLQVTWLLPDSQVVQRLDPDSTAPQILRISPVTTSRVTLRIDLTRPGPAPADDYVAVTEVTLRGQ